MNVIIQSPGFKVSEQLANYVREKINKLAHLSSNIVRADVTLVKGPVSEVTNSHCEIRLEAPGYDPFAKKSAETFERAVLETVDALYNMMKRDKDNRR
jgi:ribosomal subunit interface protein